MKWICLIFAIVLVCFVQGWIYKTEWDNDEKGPDASLIVGLALGVFITLVILFG